MYKACAKTAGKRMMAPGDLAKCSAPESWLHIQHSWLGNRRNSHQTFAFRNVIHTLWR